MGTDKELIGVEFEYKWFDNDGSEPEIYSCFVAQADPDIGITGKPFDEEEMRVKDFNLDAKGEMNTICLTKKHNNFVEKYAATKAEILTGVVKHTSSLGHIGECAF